MRKLFFINLVVFLLVFSNVKTASAALVTINVEEGVFWNVLGAENEIDFSISGKESLSFKGVAQAPTPGPDAEITLEKIEGKVQLSVVSDTGISQKDVTGYSYDLVEIEEQDEPRRIIILNVDEGFGISQRGVLAKTDYSINVDAKSRHISVEAPSGLRYVSVLPFDALNGLVKANIIDRLNSEEQIILSEGETGELGYMISGEKVIDVFNIITLPVTVKTHVSASTGEVLQIDQPAWLGLLNFLFV